MCNAIILRAFRIIPNLGKIETIDCGLRLTYEDGNFVELICDEVWHASLKLSIYIDRCEVSNLFDRAVERASKSLIGLG